MNRAEFRFAEVDKTVQRVTSVRKYRIDYRGIGIINLERRLKRSTEKGLSSP